MIYLSLSRDKKSNMRWFKPIRSNIPFNHTLHGNDLSTTDFNPNEKKVPRKVFNINTVMKKS